LLCRLFSPSQNPPFRCCGSRPSFVTSSLFCHRAGAFFSTFFVFLSAYSQDLVWTPKAVRYSQVFDFGQRSSLDRPPNRAAFFFSPHLNFTAPLMVSAILFFPPSHFLCWSKHFWQFHFAGTFPFIISLSSAILPTMFSSPLWLSRDRVRCIGRRHLIVMKPHTCVPGLDVRPLAHVIFRSITESPPPN